MQPRHLPRLTLFAKMARIVNGVSMPAKNTPSNDLLVIYVQSATHLQLLCNVTTTQIFANELLF